MTLLQMSLAGGAMTAAVLVLRALTRPRLPRRALMPLWYAVLARLLVPFSLPCRWSAYTLLARISSPAAPESAVSAPVNVPAPSVLPVPDLPAAPVTAPAVSAPALAADAAQSVDLCLLVWLAGAVGCAVFFGAQYIRCRRHFAQSLPAEGTYARRWLESHPLARRLTLRQSGRVRAPLTYGVLRPVILLPRGFDWDGESAKYVLEHEYVHVRRFDAALKLLLTAALCVHWFNPLIWCAYVFANRDIELACDEAVLRRFGSKARQAYAMALIRMAETGDGPAPLCSGFGRSAVEERITAIMKMKKTTAGALICALCLLAGVTTVFATSTVNEDREAADRRANTQTVTSVNTVLSYTDEDGQTWYSADGGKTFMSEEEYDRLYPKPEVVWWTYDEYAEWLENEKVQLQSMLGERGWTGGRGEFVWTQEIIDETIAMYEDILEQIGRGVKVSKTVDGSEDVMLMQGTDGLLGVGEGDVTAADFAEYESFGLVWDEAEKALFYNGERVRYFLDGAEVDGGTAVRLEYADAYLAGEVDLYTVRERADNSDGSYDPFGPLLRLEKRSQALSDARVSADPGLAETAAEAYFRQVTAESSAETEKLLKKYAPFGLSWELDGEGGEIRMSWQGKSVHSLFDSVEQVWIANNLNGSDLPSGAVDLEAVYENGKLTGLRETEPAQTAQGAVVEPGSSEAPVTAAEAVAEGTGESGGRTFAEIFAQFEPFNITYVEPENGGRGNVYWNGELVSRFVDLRPDGGTFTFESDEQGGLELKTQYDDEGRLSFLTGIN